MKGDKRNNTDPHSPKLTMAQIVAEASTPDRVPGWDEMPSVGLERDLDQPADWMREAQGIAASKLPSSIDMVALRELLSGRA